MKCSECPWSFFFFCWFDSQNRLCYSLSKLAKACRDKQYCKILWPLYRNNTVSLLTIKFCTGVAKPFYSAPSHTTTPHLSASVYWKSVNSFLLPFCSWPFMLCFPLLSMVMVNTCYPSPRKQACWYFKPSSWYKTSYCFKWALKGDIASPWKYCH